MRTYGVVIAFVLFASTVGKAEPQTNKRQVVLRMDDATLLVGAGKDSGRAFTCAFLFYKNMVNRDDVGIECVELKMARSGHYVVRDNVSLQIEEIVGQSGQKSLKAKLCPKSDTCQNLWGNTQRPMNLRTYVKGFHGFPFLSPKMRKLVQMANPGRSYPISSPQPNPKDKGI